MKDQLKLKAKQSLAKKHGQNVSQPLKPTRQPTVPRISQPKIADYSKIHPEVLDHVHRYLDEFKKGLSNGRR